VHKSQHSSESVNLSGINRRLICLSPRYFLDGDGDKFSAVNQG